MSVLIAALTAVLVSTGLTGPVSALGSTAAESTSQAAPRTWIIDAVDDARGARWVSRDTGTSQITIQAGDTVEWHFDSSTAGQPHDLTSQNTRSTWDQPVQQARAPGDPPISRTFTTAGTFDFLCSIHGSTMSGTVVVGDASPPPPSDEPDPGTGDHGTHLPGVSATAAPTSGAAPLAVAFSAQVSTGGPVRAFAAGLTSYPELTGTAAMVRRRGQTYASLDVSGLKPNAHHVVHVHEEACSSSNNGGAHFRFDKTQPFSEANEVWLPFTSDASGRSGHVEVTQPQRAGADAVSMVIHDPDNHALRIGCVDLAPGTADLTYTWDFGDGTTGRGTDPDHTYVVAGSHTATLTVTNSHGAQVVDTVTVTAADVTGPQTAVIGGPTRPTRADDATFQFTSSEAGSTFSCRLDGAGWRGCAARTTFRGLEQGRHRLEVRAVDGWGNTDTTPASYAWTVDRTAPRISHVRPSTVTTDRTPTVRAQVTDSLTAVRRLVLRLDGDRVGPVRYAARRGHVAWTPSRALTTGPHTARLVALDAAGNRAVREWRFRVSR